MLTVMILLLSVAPPVQADIVAACRLRGGDGF
jgi:hypothetical protein